MIALLIGYEAIARFLAPVPIHFTEAIPIAVVGLLVNILSAWLLSGGHHGHSHGHNHGDVEHDHAAHDPHSNSAHRDNNIRSAYIHVVADAAVSVLAITGLVLARIFGWMWMDPLAGIIGALVIANWSFSLLRDTGRILLDMNPDQRITTQVREAIESDGDRLIDLHLWRLGPGHLGAVVSVLTSESRDCAFYRTRLKSFKSLSHVTVEVTKSAA